MKTVGAGEANMTHLLPAVERREEINPQRGKAKLGKRIANLYPFLETPVPPSSMPAHSGLFAFGDGGVVGGGEG